MRLITLTLRGFTGMKAGLGRDELTLDLDQQAGDAEIVAVARADGIGKSTVIDNLQDW